MSSARRTSGQRSQKKQRETAGERKCQPTGSSSEASQSLSRSQLATCSTIHLRELHGEILPGIPTESLEAKVRGDVEFGKEAALEEAGIAEYGRLDRDSSNDGNQFGVRKIHGPDERVRIFETTQDPYSSICYLRITAADGTQLVGTGWLLGPRTVVTAGHCVWSRRFGNAFAQEITVFPGRNGRNYTESTRECDLKTVKQWAHEGHAEFDFGAIILDQPLGDAEKFDFGCFGLSTFDDEELLQMKLNVVGYPADKQPATMWGHSECLRDVKPQQLLYTIDTYGGHSGSPVILAENGDFFVVGIHNAGGRYSNFAVRINEQVYDHLIEWKRAGAT